MFSVLQVTVDIFTLRARAGRMLFYIINIQASWILAKKFAALIILVVGFRVQ